MDHVRNYDECELKIPIEKNFDEFYGYKILKNYLKFKRLAEMTENKPEKVIEAIKEHKSDLMEVSECSKKIRRSPENPIPSYDDNYKRLEKNRTCYVKVMIFKEKSNLHLICLGFPGDRNSGQSSRLFRSLRIWICLYDAS